MSFSSIFQCFVFCCFSFLFPAGVAFENLLIPLDKEDRKGLSGNFASRAFANIDGIFACVVLIKGIKGFQSEEMSR